MEGLGRHGAIMQLSLGGGVYLYLTKMNAPTLKWWCDVARPIWVGQYDGSDYTGDGTEAMGDPIASYQGEWRPLFDEAGGLIEERLADFFRQLEAA